MEESEVRQLSDDEHKWLFQEWLIASRSGLLRYVVHCTCYTIKPDSKTCGGHIYYILNTCRGYWPEPQTE